ncbi:MAG: hypothetical protein ACYC8T_21865, partial [Myxococcaceae bacterium]
MNARLACALSLALGLPALGVAPPPLVIAAPASLVADGRGHATVSVSGVNGPPRGLRLEASAG